MSDFDLRKLLIVGLLFACVGCGSGAGPVLYRVNGVLTVNGSPVPEVNIQLVPVQDRNKAGLIASGATNSKGEFNLSSPGGPGAAAGVYKVVLATMKPMSYEEQQKFQKDMSAHEVATSRPSAQSRQRAANYQGHQGNQAPVKKNELKMSLPFPSEYMSVVTSPKEFEIKNQGCTLELKL